jgi:hypothetical protein
MLVDERMIRKQIYLEPSQNDAIKLLSTRKGATEAEIIREALDLYLVAHREAQQDPLMQMIGRISSGKRDGSLRHDRDIYFLPGERQ